MRHSTVLLVLPVLLLFSTSCQQGLNYQSDKVEYAERGMVSSAHPLASDAGATILEAGGNAIDAAIAMQFALAVVYPRAGNIGGGGFMVYRHHNGETAALDYREMAPREAHRDMYLNDQDEVIEGLSRYGPLAVGVPGSVHGMLEAHKKFGSLPWSDLLEPAIKLADDGYQITATEAGRLNRFKDDFIQYNGEDIPFVKSSEWEEGDLLVQKNLAKTFRRIADNKRNGFYSGATAEALLKTITSNGGIITQLDLDDYTSYWREPVHTDYKGYTVYSMPPPSSGGIALIQLLEISEHLDLDSFPFHGPESMHHMAEIERLVYADRAKHLGDADYYPVPVDSLLNEAYLLSQSQIVHPDTARPSEDVYAKPFHSDLESYETTHFSIVDMDGNAAAVTTTLNSNFGSKVYVKEAGFFLNNQMDDFSIKPGVPNQYGLVGNEANAIEPGKRMLSSMTPTIVVKDNQPFLILGTPGGSTIITSVFQVIVNMVDYNMSLEDAIAAPRFHHQWLPDRILVEENRFDEHLLQQLRDKGHNIETAKYIGLVDAVARYDSIWVGVGDPRSDDDAEGVD